MSRTVHARFIKLSKNYTQLHDAFKHVGPVNIKSRKVASLPVMLCRAVVGQQLSVTVARSIWDRILSQSNKKPLIPYLSKAKEADLRSCGLSRVKAKSLKAIAEASLSGDIHPLKLKRLDQLSRMEQLVSIYGVGKWTADMINLFYFLDEDVWPEGDVAVVKTFQQLIGQRRSMSKTAELFSPYRSYLALYMYGYVNNPPLEK